jgi:pimeloyl-ACP methyl ester carboxylesterase
MWKKILIGIIVIIGALLLYATVLRKSGILTKADVKAKYATPVSHFLNWNGSEIHYTDRGSGMPVLMIHGMGGSCFDFALTDSLLNDSYRVIRVDLPGFGMSDFPSDSTGTAPDLSQEYIRFFKFFLDTLHIDSLYVMGNSMGGMMSWYMAVQLPGKVKKLVLLNSAGYDMEQISNHVMGLMRNRLVQAVMRKGVPLFFTEMGLSRAFYDKSVLTDEKFQRATDFWNRKGSIDVTFKIAETHNFLDTALIARVACPTLILWGRQDELIPVDHASRFHRNIRNSREIIYDPCGHVPMVERPLDVNRDVRTFFTE